MLDIIAMKALDVLKSAGLDIKDIDYESIVNNEVGSAFKPKINISIDSGTFKSIAMNATSETPIISFYLVVQNLRGEKQRKFQNYRLIHAVIDALYLNDLGLGIQNPLTPVSYSNSTTKEFNAAGYSIYQINFKCSFNYAVDSEPGDLGELSHIVNNYYVADEPDAGYSSDIKLNDTDGGNANTESTDDSSGGSAGTKDFTVDINGGNANSTFRD